MCLLVVEKMVDGVITTVAELNGHKGDSMVVGINAYSVDNAVAPKETVGRSSLLVSAMSVTSTGISRMSALDVSKEMMAMSWCSLSRENRRLHGYWTAEPVPI